MCGRNCFFVQFLNIWTPRIEKSVMFFGSFLTWPLIVVVLLFACFIFLYHIWVPVKKLCHPQSYSFTLPLDFYHFIAFTGNDWCHHCPIWYQIKRCLLHRIVQWISSLIICFNLFMLMTFYVEYQFSLTMTNPFTNCISVEPKTTLESLSNRKCKPRTTFREAAQHFHWILNPVNVFWEYFVRMKTVFKVYTLQAHFKGVTIIQLNQICTGAGWELEPCVNAWYSTGLSRAPAPPLPFPHHSLARQLIFTVSSHMLQQMLTTCSKL